MSEVDLLETILLVETDALQRSVVAQYLRDCGYRVVEATNAAEAMTALVHQEVHVLVTDLALRDESGFQLSAKAKEVRPDLKVVVTHSAERTAKIAGDLCEDGPLDQPYHPQHLVERIRRLKRS
ncbi:response regulator [Rhizobium sp. SIMBA_035]